MRADSDVIVGNNISDFNWDDPASIRRTCKTCKPILLTQSWAGSPESNLRKAVARLGRHENSIICFVEMDGIGRSSATGNNQRLWELGDTVELFLQPPNSKAYFEIHLSCEGHQLQLRFPDENAVSEARRSGDLSPYLLPEDSFRGKTFAGQAGWCALFEVPVFTALGRMEERRNGGVEEQMRAVWRYSVCRYDYGAGESPVLSSTSPLTKLDFHRVGEWGRIRFESA